MQEVEETRPTMIGVVVDCEFVQVREEPNVESEELTVLPVGTEVMIEVTESTEDFYKVFTEISIEGFCMKEFIQVL